MKSKDTPHISPQRAMDDYFQDMLGHAVEDPLKKLEAQELAELKKTQDLASEYKSINIPAKAKAKKATQTLIVTDFAEPKTKTGNISPLIIPAAFPKLAPAAVEKAVLLETKVETKLETKVDVKETVKATEKTVQAEVTAPKAETKTRPLIASREKLDKNTALSILLKQQQKLSSAQRLRLKEKMQQLEHKKQLAAQQQDIQTTKPKPMTEVASSVALKTKADSAVETAPLSVSLAQNSEQAKPVLSKHVRPEWTERRFECLLFSVAGLKLAVPLISLGAIYKIEKEFTPLVGRAKWFMGLYHHLDRNVRVVDTAQWVMPERCSVQVRDNYKFIIRLGDSDWGMACDAVHQSIQLSPDQVKWRSERTKRVWLYGTVIDHMCGLIDAEALNSMLEQQAPINFSH